MFDQAEGSISKGRLRPVLTVASLVGLAVVVGLVACSSGSSGTSSGKATVNVMLSDPATCMTPNGPYQAVYVTVTDVEANTSATASATGSGWVDLTKDSTVLPKQVNLLGLANNECFLASLGDNLELQAGSYRQIRVTLASTSAGLTDNQCSNGSANCVVTKDGTYTLQLASEDKTGIKIPSGQIASGAFTISAGQTKDLDIDFLTCESIVQQGNGKYLLKPVLHAGEVSTTSSSINGTVEDASGGLVSGNVYVALEQPDANGIYRVVQSTQADSTDGTFVFCPLPAGTYAVVVVGSNSSGELYQPTIVTGVTTGSTTGTLKLNLPPTALAAVSSANLKGEVTSAGTSSGIAETISMSALETVNGTTYTIPQQPAASPYFNVTLPVTTAASTASLPCPTGTYCATYTLPVTSGGAYYGAWSASAAASANGVTLTPASATTTLASYAVDGTTSSCTTTDLTTSPATALTGTGSFTDVAISQILNFTGCN